MSVLAAAPRTPLVLGTESVVVVALFLGFGYLLADAALWRRDVDAVVRWGLAVPAVAAYTTVLTLLHMATGGRVLSNAWLTRGLTLAVAGGAVAWRVARRRGPRPDRDRVDRMALIVLGVVLVAGVALWGLRAFRAFPLTNVGDTPWHMGMASQFLNGETSPASTVTGAIPNQYPWLFHAMIALLTRFMPGGRAYFALDPIQMLQAAGAVLALYALGRELNGKWLTGAAAAFLGGIAGSIGLRYPGDAGRRPYALALHNASPPYPRDIAFVMLIASLLLLVAAYRRTDHRLLVAAGAVLGLAGLAGAEAFFLGLGVAVLLVVVPSPFGRARILMWLVLPAIAVWAIWAFPTAVSYLRLGGFVNITHVGAVDLPATTILKVWGIGVPLAALGFVLSARRLKVDPIDRILLAVFLVAAGLLVFSSLAEAGLGRAFLSLGRRHRYWPLLHLAVVLYAAVGVTAAFEWVRTRHLPAAGALAAALAAAMVGLMAPSSIRLGMAVPSIRNAVLDASLRGNHGTVLNELSDSTSGKCVVATPELLDGLVFSYTGYRMVLFRYDGYRENLARIRWKDIYRHIPGDQQRLHDNEMLVKGGPGSPGWQDLVRAYGVDALVTEASAAQRTAYSAYAPRIGLGPKGVQYLVVRLSGCG